MNAPMVTEEDGCVSEQCVQALWQAATGLYLEVTSNAVPAMPAIQEGASIGMSRDSGNGLSVKWLGVAPSLRAQRVVELMG